MTKTMILAIALIGISSLLAGAQLASADTWDAAADFWTDNPNCAWTYGYAPLNLSGSQTKYNLAQYIGNLNIIEYLNSGTDRGYIARSFWNYPYLATFGIWWDAYGLNLHPGVNGVKASVQWSSPIDGWVQVDATLMGADITGTTSDGHILVNNVPVWDCVIDGFGGVPGTLAGRFGSSPEASYRAVINVSPNDTIACAVGWGSNGNYSNDCTAIRFTIKTASPTVSAGCISGTVRSSQSGNPVLPGVNVTAGDYSTWSDANGRFWLSLAPGAYNVQFSRSDCVTCLESFVEAVANRTTTLNAVLYPASGAPPVGFISGVVKSSLPGGMVLPGVTARTLSGGYSAVTDSFGRYTLTVASPGTYTVEFSRSGYTTYQLPGVAVATNVATTVNASLSVATTASRIADLHDSSYVSVAGKTATCNGTTFTDGFFIQEPDRTRGIRIVGGTGSQSVVSSNSVTVAGTVAIDANGQLYVNADLVSRGPGTGMKPLGMNNWGFSSVRGLLTTLWGRITYIDPASRYFYIDDGSGLNDGSGNAGLKVDCGELSAPLSSVIVGMTKGQFVKVTGVAFKVDASPAVRPRSAADIQ